MYTTFRKIHKEKDAEPSEFEVSVTQEGNEVFFRIKCNTQLHKLMNAYCDRQLVDRQSVDIRGGSKPLMKFCREKTPKELDSQAAKKDIPKDEKH